MRVPDLATLRRIFQTLTVELFAGGDRSSQREAMVGAGEARMVRERRAQGKIGPEDDVLSVLLSAEVGGKRLTDSEVAAILKDVSLWPKYSVSSAILRLVAKIPLSDSGGRVYRKILNTIALHSSFVH